MVMQVNRELAVSTHYSSQSFLMLVKDQGRETSGSLLRRYRSLNDVIKRNPNNTSAILPPPVSTVDWTNSKNFKLREGA
jgi:hypothetical protein